ncbi:hypothetical protein CYMTET_43521 [Cymbomonas tetramitiformis]|uniref:Ribonuclease P/MRP protein subunit POP5 n=1 Tax=Cymbomonas tetramitiformis TaxID=36881 RepID=A0AAE0C3P1_9CHLO|nr:hypothetical protein CYMTET_43521 [Cymbomonas tetramitiformis]
MVRFKNRYLLLEVVWKDGKSDSTVGEDQLLSAFRESLGLNFGDVGRGVAAQSLQVKYFNPLTNLCIIRCSRDSYRQVWCAITLISEIRKRTVMLRMIHLGGSVRTCQTSALKYNLSVIKDFEPYLGEQYTQEVAAIKRRIQALDL